MSTHLSPVSINLISDAVSAIKKKKIAHHSSINGSKSMKTHSHPIRPHHGYTLDEMLTLQFPSTLNILSTIDFTSLHVLYSIDVNHTGIYTLSDILNFCEFCENVHLHHKLHHHHHSTAATTTATVFYNPIHAYTFQSFYEAIIQTTTAASQSSNTHTHTHTDTDIETDGNDTGSTSGTGT